MGLGAGVGVEGWGAGFRECKRDVSLWPRAGGAVLLLCSWTLDEPLFSLCLSVLTYTTKGWRNSGLEVCELSISLQEPPLVWASNFTLN